MARRSQSLEELPIDIQWSGLVDWLVDRRRIPATWAESIRAIRAQIDEGLENLPYVPAVTDIIQKNYINYFHCKRLLELLEQSEQDRGASTRNIFGQYRGTLLQSWYNIIKAYEKDTVYLGEAARILWQNTTYEIPNAKKAIAQNEKLVSDLGRKLTEYDRSIADARRRLAAQLKELGIEGEQPRLELLALGTYLPEMYAAVEEQLLTPKLERALAYHGAVVEHIGGAADGLLSSIKRVRAAERGAGPSSGSAAAGAGGAAAAADAGGEIDWGGGGGGADIDWGITSDAPAPAPAPADIDWGITSEAPAPAPAAADIDWGITSEAPAAEAEAQPEAQPEAADIDWGITSEAQPEQPQETADTPDTPDTQQEYMGALIADADVRSALVNEALELRAFLEQRRVELGENDLYAFVEQYSTTPAAASADEAALDEMQRGVDSLLGALESPRLQQLVLIQTSDKYLDRLVTALQQSQAREGRLREVQAGVARRREAAAAAVEEQAPKLQAAVAATRELKQQVEEALSGLYNRQINIIGEINNLLR